MSRSASTVLSSIAAAAVGKLIWPTGLALNGELRRTKDGSERLADLPPSAGSRPTTFSTTLAKGTSAPSPSSIAAKGATSAVDLACYWSNSVRPYALRGSPFLRPPVSASLWHFELLFHEGHEVDTDDNPDVVVQTSLKGAYDRRILELSVVCSRDGRTISRGSAWCVATKTAPPFDGVVVPPLPLSEEQTETGRLRWKALQRRAELRPRTVSAADAEAGAVVYIPTYSHFEVASLVCMEQIAGAIGKAATNPMPEPSRCADVGPLLMEAVSVLQRQWMDKTGTELEVSGVEVWLSHVPPNTRLQLWFCTEACELEGLRTWVTGWHLKEPVVRMKIMSRQGERQKGDPLASL